MDKVIIAIDPGASGGIVVANNSGLVSCVAMPDTDTDVVEEIRKAYKLAKTTESEIVCIYEKVGGFAGGKGSPGSRMFNFGDGFGVVKGALIAFKIKCIERTPQQWQKPLSLGKREYAKIAEDFPQYPKEAYKAEEKRIDRLNAVYKTEWKNKLKAEAQRLYPNIKVTLKTSDALLILEYYKRFLNK